MCSKLTLNINLDYHFVKIGHILEKSDVKLIEFLW